MDLKLQGKKAFISGSTSGIGLAIAKSLALEGAEIMINGRSEESVKKATTLIESTVSGAKVDGFAVNFEKADQIDSLHEALSKVDILVNNVGIFTSQSFEETPDEDWFRLFEVNVMSGVRLSRMALPGMLHRNDGRIIFISSECAQLVPPDLIAYSTTKTALHTLSRGLAQLTRGTNVTVNTVMPGSTLSEGAESFLSEQATKQNKSKEEVAREFFKEIRTTSLAERFASTDEIAHAVTYLASPISAMTNGSVFSVDGGSVPGVF